MAAFDWKSISFNNMNRTIATVSQLESQHSLFWQIFTGNFFFFRTYSMLPFKLMGHKLSHPFINTYSEVTLQRIIVDVTLFSSFPPSSNSVIIAPVPCCFNLTTSSSKSRSHSYLMFIFGALIMLIKTIPISYLKQLSLLYIYMQQTDRGSCVCVTSLLAELD